MKLHGTTLLVALAVWLTAANLAHAGSGAVIIGGDADGARREIVGEAVREIATKAGWSLVPSLSRQDTQSLLACKDPSLYSCVPSTLASSGVDRLFVVKANRGRTDSGDPQLTLDATLIGTEPRTLVTNRKHCDHCADDQLRAQTAALVQTMIDEFAQRSGRTVLDVKTTPPGARILLDGKEIGFSDARFSIPPGPHQITLEKPGYLSKTIDAKIDEGVTKAIDETLVASDVSRVRPGARSRLPTYLLVGGLVLLAGGATMIVLDEDPGPTTDRMYFNGAPLGTVIASAGIVALGLSIYTWKTSKQTSKPTSTPTVSFVPGGAMIGWSKSL